MHNRSFHQLIANSKGKLKSLDLLLLPYDVYGFRSLWALLDIEAHRIALLKGLEPLALDSGEVNKNLRPVLRGNKTKALGLIKPFHSPFHQHALLSNCGSRLEGDILRSRPELIYPCQQILSSVNFRNKASPSPPLY